MVKSSLVKCFRRLINPSVKIFRRLKMFRQKVKFLSLFTDELFTAKV